MSDGPGLTRLYKDGGHRDVGAEEIEGLLSDGWKDEPQPSQMLSGRIGGVPGPANVPPPTISAPAPPVSPDPRSIHDQARAPDPTPAPKRRRGRPIGS